jgi:hypothetical protein
MADVVISKKKVKIAEKNNSNRMGLKKSVEIIHDVIDSRSDGLESEAWVTITDFLDAYKDLDEKAL